MAGGNSLQAQGHLESDGSRGIDGVDQTGLQCGWTTRGRPKKDHMSLDTVTYSTITNVQDNSPHEETVEVPALIVKLLTHKVVAAKENAGLFSFCTFQKGRKVADAEYVHAIVLDFDNTPPAAGPLKDEMKSVCIPNPVHPKAAADMLRAAGVRSVVVSSHNHKPYWPKFRAIVFVDDAIPPWVYAEVVDEMLVRTGLGSMAFAAGLDRSCLRPAQFYYWPSHPPERAQYKFAAYIHGENYELSDIVLKPPAWRTSLSGATSGSWSASVIASYYFERVPGLQRRSETEARGPCPIHGGNNPTSFSVNLETGSWHCFSECAAAGRGGGGIYQFHFHHQMVRRDLNTPWITWAEAKQQVHLLLGFPSINGAT